MLLELQIISLGLIELQFLANPWNYRIGQWALLNSPYLDHDERHSCTITSSTFDPYISLHVPLKDGFGRALDEMIQPPGTEGPYIQATEIKFKDLNDHDPPVLRINGPYGKPAKGVLNNSITLLIGTDAGIFPWIAVLKDLWHMGEGQPVKNSGPLPGIHIIWVSDMTMFDAFQTLLSLIEQQYRSSGIAVARYLRLHIYDTREVQYVDTSLRDSLKCAIPPPHFTSAFNLLNRQN